MKKRFFLFGLIVLTIISVSCKLESDALRNVVSGIISGQSDQEPGINPYMLSGVFTVNSEGKQVRFSLGALYWDGESFRMEENQYDFRTWSDRKSVINGVETIIDEFGTTNGTPEGHIGLFCWSKDMENTYALDYDSSGNSISDTFALADGGAIEGWDVLSADEWKYLIGFDSNVDARQDASSKFGLATITTDHEASVHGLVLLPDSWTLPDGCSWTEGKGNGWTTNSYDATQWASMEQAGAVFLPAAGDRYKASVNSVSYYGNWWSSTPDSSAYYYAHCMSFGSNTIYVDTGNRGYGYGVRLVAPVSN